jgi:hypothetical protein
LNDFYHSEVTHEAAAPSEDVLSQSILESEVRKEDRSLWPSLAGLVDELIAVLQSASDRWVT